MKKKPPETMKKKLSSTPEVKKRPKDEPLVLVAINEHPEWFFVWTCEQPYTTTICGWTREAVKVAAVENNGDKNWKQTYRRGGRVVRVRLSLKIA